MCVIYCYAVVFRASFVDDASETESPGQDRPKVVARQAGAAGARCSDKEDVRAEVKRSRTTRAASALYLVDLSLWQQVTHLRFWSFFFFFAAGGGGKDADKIAQKARKATQSAEQADRDYQNAVEKLKANHAEWVQDMQSTCVMYQKLEEERLDFLRNTLWNFTNILSTVCVADDQVRE